MTGRNNPDFKRKQQMLLDILLKKPETTLKPSQSPIESRKIVPFEKRNTEMERRRVLVFGCSKAGKTSMLNTITGQEMEVSDAAVGTTFGTQGFNDFEYNGKIYQFIDTAGLDEGDKGTVSSADAIISLINFIKNEGQKGFNLFVMVMAKGAVSQAIQRNYELFIKHVKPDGIPTLCVVTRCEDDEVLNKWVGENKGYFEEQYNIKFNNMAGSCFAQERGGKLAKIYEELCEESRTNVMKMIEKTCSEVPHSIVQGRFAWFPIGVL